MTREETDNYAILTPGEGKWLTNEKVCSQKVYTPLGSDGNVWREIEEEEREALEAGWKAEAEAEETRARAKAMVAAEAVE